MWPFGEKVTVYEYPKEPIKEAVVKIDEAHKFWLKWHGYTVTVVHGPFSGYWGVAQDTNLESQTVSVRMKEEANTIWFKVVDLVCLDRQPVEKGV